MTLRNYYLSLPRNPQPKDQLLNDIVRRCDVTKTTARNWVLYDVKPTNPEHVAVLCELTGLKEEELWEE